MFKIQPVLRHHEKLIQQRIDSKTKPIGSLGKLESLAKTLALINQAGTSQSKNIPPDTIPPLNPVVIVFAADHGIAQHPISIAPSAVTGLMVKNFLAGGAAINSFCRSQSIPLAIVDAGMATPLRDHSISSHQVQYFEQRLGPGTADMSQRAAMTHDQVRQGLQWGAERVRAFRKADRNLFILGEMGIGNTSSASAILSLLLSLPAAETVGSGTGINHQQLVNKQQLVQQAIERARNQRPNLQGETNSAIEILVQVGGYEIVQMVGAICGSAEEGCPVLIDGFIVTAAAMLAVKINPLVKDYLIFSHRSGEQAHQIMLDALAVEPLLDLSLRLGEGTGAVLAFPLLQSSVAFYNEMASMADLGIEV